VLVKLRILSDLRLSSFQHGVFLGSLHHLVEDLTSRCVKVASHAGSIVELAVQLVLLESFNYLFEVFPGEVVNICTRV
jgi:hypothetical protein